MSVWNRAGPGTVLRLPLLGAGRARGQLPLVLEEVLEEIVVPPCGRRGPGDLEPAGDGVGSHTGFVAALPAETLFLEVAAFRFGADMLVRWRGTVRLAEGVSTGNQRHRLLVVHRHAAEGLANVPCRGHGIRIAVRPLRVHVDQAHLYRAVRIGQLPVAAVALVAEPRGFRTPVDVLGLPDVLAAAGEAECLEPHRLQRHVAGQDDQIGPRNLPAVLLLDRPEQPARLVDVRVVRPAAEGREPYLARTRTAAAVVDAVGAGGVPRHADEESPVMAEVRRPPALRVRHHRLEILLDSGEIQRLELFGVVELRAHRIARRMVRVEGVQTQLVRPPVAVRSAAARAGRERAFAFVAHVDVDLY